MQAGDVQAEGLALDGKVGPETVHFNFRRVYVTQRQAERLGLRREHAQVFFFRVDDGGFAVRNKFFQITLQNINFLMVFLQV